MYTRTGLEIRKDGEVIWSFDQLNRELLTQIGDDIDLEKPAIKVLIGMMDIVVDKLNTDDLRDFLTFLYEKMNEAPTN